MAEKLPEKKDVIAMLKEFKKSGREAFLEEHGRAARTHFIMYEDQRYDLKAVWAAAHRDSSWSGEFHTKKAAKNLRALGFVVFNSEEADSFLEGQRRNKEVTSFNRNPALVAAAHARHGFICMVCDFDFQSAYGDLGKGYIECHHLKEMSEDEIRESTVEDIAVVCANCHRMIHRGGKLRNITEMRELVQTFRGYRPGTII